VKRISHSSALPVALLAGLLAWLLPAAVRSQDDSRYTVITGTGQTLYRIAIPPVIDGGAGAAAAKTAQSVMTRDMTLIGLFKVLSPKGFLANLGREGTGIKLQDWINVGAQGVVKAKARAEGNKIAIDFYLYDTAKGDTPIIKKTYRGSRRGVRRLAHRFGNDIVKHYTGKKGIFLTKIAFASGNRRSKRSHIYVMDYDGFGVYRASRTGNQNVLPSWSPRGQLAYTSYLWRNPDLYVVSGSGGGRARRISKRPGLNIGAAWSSRGQLAVTLSKDGNSEIYLLNAKGGIIRRLTKNAAIDASPTFSPGGGQIAFVSNRGGSPQIYVMSTGGGGARRLTYAGNYNQEPDWCPDPGTPRVAFTGRDDKGNYDIFTVDIKSNELKRLTQGQGSNTSPSWAPNGQLLVFSSSRGGLWLMNADGLNQHKIYRGGGMTPDWSY
jgi:TolB protein